MSGASGHRPPAPPFQSDAGRVGIFSQRTNQTLMSGASGHLPPAPPFAPSHSALLPRQLARQVRAYSSPRPIAPA
eukprot:229734-Prorocentrum_minimum.AAC.1